MIGVTAVEMAMTKKRRRMMNVTLLVKARQDDLIMPEAKHRPIHRLKRLPWVVVPAAGDLTRAVRLKQNPARP